MTVQGFCRLVRYEDDLISKCIFTKQSFLFKFHGSSSNNSLALCYSSRSRSEFNSAALVFLATGNYAFCYLEWFYGFMADFCY